ncbi:MAG: helix-turn-helix domain-containing protein [Nitrosopumilus sp.]|nr:helix-turn-helix domain-containing protein [Nitrosopumilus sp.]MDH5659280.1 helix-turn-helix domain-containing protein [Nitrosopumilus sp.]
MADISTAAHTSMDIFRAIMDHGPLTLYSANSKTRIPIGTVHRHFKQLNESGKIRVYESKSKGRKKIVYGPTMYGIVSFYKQDKEFAGKIENYYLIWIEDKEFQRDLEAEGFDISVENLKKSKQVFRKYMNYFSAVEEQIEKIRSGKDSISRDMQVFFSSMMLSSNPHYQKLWTELYQELPGMQKNLEEYMNAMIKSYSEFKKSLRR